MPDKPKTRLRKYFAGSLCPAPLKWDNVIFLPLGTGCGIITGKWLVKIPMVRRFCGKPLSSLPRDFSQHGTKWGSQQTKSPGQAPPLLLEQCPGTRGTVLPGQQKPAGNEEEASAASRGYRHILAERDICGESSRLFPEDSREWLTAFNQYKTRTGGHSV